MAEVSGLPGFREVLNHGWTLINTDEEFGSSRKLKLRIVPSSFPIRVHPRPSAVRILQIGPRKIPPFSDCHAGKASLASASRVPLTSLRDVQAQ